MTTNRSSKSSIASLPKESDQFSVSDRESGGKVKSVDLGGRRIIKNRKKKQISVLCLLVREGRVCKKKMSQGAFSILSTKKNKKDICI